MIDSTRFTERKNMNYYFKMNRKTTNKVSLIHEAILNYSATTSIVFS
jgi:hypothetical protein